MTTPRSPPWPVRRASEGAKEGFGTSRIGPLTGEKSTRRGRPRTPHANANDATSRGARRCATRSGFPPRRSGGRKYDGMQRKRKAPPRRAGSRLRKRTSRKRPRTPPPGKPPRLPSRPRKRNPQPVPSGRPTTGWRGSAWERPATPGPATAAPAPRQPPTIQIAPTTPPTDRRREAPGRQERPESAPLTGATEKPTHRTLRANLVTAADSETGERPWTAPGAAPPERGTTTFRRRAGSAVPVPRQIHPQGSLQSGICPGPTPHGDLLACRRGSAMGDQFHPPCAITDPPALGVRRAPKERGETTPGGGPRRGRRKRGACGSESKASSARSARSCRTSRPTNRGGAGLPHGGRRGAP
jgi:hypothetical protein